MKPMLLRAKCPGCNKVVKAGDDWAGRSAKCPGCGGKIQFPPAVPISPLSAPTPPPFPGGDDLTGFDDFISDELRASASAAISPTRQCPFCAETIALAAKKCKHCGEFLDDQLRREFSPLPVVAAQPVANPAKKSSAPALGCLLVFLLIGGCFMLLPNVPDGGSHTAAPLVEQSPEKQRQRKDLIDNLVSRGVFHKVEVPGTLPHVWVTPVFRALNFDDKQTFVSVVYAYYAPVDLVVIKDSLTGHRIGSYSPQLGLRIE